MKHIRRFWAELKGQNDISEEEATRLSKLLVKRLDGRHGANAESIIEENPQLLEAEIRQTLEETLPH